MDVLATVIYGLVILLLLPYAVIALAGIGAGTVTLLKGGGRKSASEGATRRSTSPEGTADP